jgi:hypothetical protein
LGLDNRRLRSFKQAAFLIPKSKKPSPGLAG